MFRIGQKVVCVHTGTTPRGEIPPVKGEVYTIRDLVLHQDGVIGIRLVEIRNAPRLYRGSLDFMECTFGTVCFRPVVERKTSISIFTKMLKTEHADV